MIKNLIQLYCMIICLVSTIATMIITGIMLVNVTDILFTKYKFASELNKFTSNTKYIKHNNHPDSESKKKLQAMTSKEVSVLRLADKDSYIDDKKKAAQSTLIASTTWLIVFLLFFWIHWRLYKKHSYYTNI